MDQIWGWGSSSWGSGLGITKRIGCSSDVDQLSSSWRFDTNNSVLIDAHLWRRRPVPQTGEGRSFAEMTEPRREGVCPEWVLKDLVSHRVGAPFLESNFNDEGVEITQSNDILWMIPSVTAWQDGYAAIWDSRMLSERVRLQKTMHEFFGSHSRTPNTWCACGLFMLMRLNLLFLLLSVLTLQKDWWHLTVMELCVSMKLRSSWVVTILMATPSPTVASPIDSENITVFIHYNEYNGDSSIIHHLQKTDWQRLFSFHFKISINYLNILLVLGIVFDVCGL